MIRWNSDDLGAIRTMAVGEVADDEDLSPLHVLQMGRDIGRFGRLRVRRSSLLPTPAFSSRFALMLLSALDVKERNFGGDRVDDDGNNVVDDVD